MVEKPGKIFYVGTDSQLFINTSRILFECGHKIVISSNTPLEALQNFTKILPRGANLAIVESDKNALKIIQELRNSLFPIFILGLGKHAGDPCYGDVIADPNDERKIKDGIWYLLHIPTGEYYSNPHEREKLDAWIIKMSKKLG